MKTIYDVISDTYLDHLEKHIDLIQWYYHDKTASENDEETDNFSFSHLLFDGNELSSFYGMFTGLILECISKCDIDLEEYYLKRARLGLISKLPKQVIHRKHLDYYVDKEPEALGNIIILYYLNESDGYTYFYTDEGVITNRYKRNSLIYFDGLIEHSSSSPVNHNKRVALNINLFRK